LQAAFGDCFLDVRKYLVNYGLVDAGITPTSQDLTDIAADVIPSSLRSDSTHFTAAGYTLVANFVSRAIRAKGW
jgi:lysophospholipase L1-like esterase